MALETDGTWAGTWDVSRLACFQEYTRQRCQQPQPTLILADCRSVLRYHHRRARISHHLYRQYPTKVCRSIHHPLLLLRHSSSPILWLTRTEVLERLPTVQFKRPFPDQPRRCTAVSILQLHSAALARRCQTLTIARIAPS